MKEKPRVLNLLLVFVFLFGSLGGMPKTVEAEGVIRISQVYGGGGNSGATLTNDFIELFNAGDTAIDITGWSVQYASSTGTSWQVTQLTGIVQPGRYYLVQEAQGAGGTEPLPTPDATGTIAMSGSNGKVALVDSTTALSGACPTGTVDFVGYGTANCYEGSGATPGLSNTTAAIRKSNGCMDTEDNASDFDIGSPNPRNSASPENLCGPIEVFPTELFFSEYIEGSSYNKALEIYNGTGTAIDLDLGDYELKFYFNGSATAGTTIDLTGTVVDGDVFVVADDGSAAAILAETDQTSGSNFFSGDDAVELTKGGVVIDSIGQVGVDPGSEWGSGATSTQDNTIRRMDTICEGDTDSSDPFDPSIEWVGYAQDTFDGLGAHTTNCTLPDETAPSVQSTNPTNGADFVPVDSNIVITFDEPVTLNESRIQILCTASGILTFTVTNNNPEFTLDPDTDFYTSESCTVEIAASAVTDIDDNIMDADYSFSFDVVEACGDEFTPIYEIQGSGLTSPLLGEEHSTEGVVVGDFQSGKYGFFIQDTTGDMDDTTSDGIFIYEPYGSDIIDVSVGDHVRVHGTVTEYDGLTEINASHAWLCSSGETLPEPIVIDLPVDSVDDFEAYEGMYVSFPQTLVISEYFNFDRFGEVVLTTDRQLNPTAFIEPGPDAMTAYDLQERSRITLDDGRSWSNPDPAIHPNGEIFTMDNRFRGGDTIQGVFGVLGQYEDEYESYYRVQPTQVPLYSATNPRPEVVDIIEDDLKIASLNVYNYFTTIDTGADICGPSGDMECRGADTADELTRQRDKIIAALAAIDADIVGLMEIENDRLGASTPDYAVADLVAGLNALVGVGTYDYVATGAIGTDAIKVALIYQTGSVTPVGDHAILDSSVDVRFLDDYNRPVLAQSFMDIEEGKIVTVAVNHLKSKGSDCEAVGDPDLGDGQGNCNLTRKAAAEAEVDWLATDPTESGVDHYLIIGDLNSYDKEDPIDAIKLGADDLPGTDDDYFDMIHEIQGDLDYGYVFDGRIGYLDYAMVHNSLVDNVVDAILWKINADEPDLIDYDMSYKKDAQDALYAPDAYRSSDHDPVIVTLSLNDAPVSVADDYATDEDVPLVVDDSTGVLENDSDPEYQDLTAVLVTPAVYGTLTLNDDGSFTYTPNADFNGSDSFEYKASDGELESDPVTVTITINAVNDAPVAVAEAYETDEDVPLVVEAPGVLTNDTDVDGDTLTAVLVTDVTNGTLELNLDGSFTYTPNADFNGTDTFEYKASDGLLESNVVTVTITINPVDDTFEIFLPIITK